jgi:ribonucleoside-diphosphate reductase alpha chain
MTQRRRLPGKRRSVTQSARVGGNKVHVTTSAFPDGSLGEVFVDLHKIGSFSRGMLHCFAKLFSIAFQYGVPLHVLTKSFRDVEFAPNGDVTGHESITKAKSIVDYVMQVLEISYPSK